VDNAPWVLMRNNPTLQKLIRALSLATQASYAKAGMYLRSAWAWLRPRAAAASRSAVLYARTRDRRVSRAALLAVATTLGLLPLLVNSSSSFAEGLHAHDAVYSPRIDTQNVTVSHYVNWLYQPDADAISERTGCSQAAGAPGYVFLGLGRQVPGGSTAFGWDGRRTMADGLRHALNIFASALNECAKGGKSFVIVPMTSNYHLDDVALAGSFGTEWGDLIESLRETEKLAHVEFLGGWDVEPSWGSPVAARAWVDAYKLQTKSPLISGPSADGCPFGPGRTSCNNGWSVSDLVYVSWSIPGSVVLPQIYTPSGSMARQWANLADVAFDLGFTPAFGGPLVQALACAERGCNGTANDAATSYRQLREALDASRQSGSLPLPGASDIRWG
jgi:hypothetical protein